LDAKDNQADVALLWHCQNGKLHGHNFKESKQKALAMKRQEAQAVYASSEENITDNKAWLLHHHPTANILN